MIDIQKTFNEIIANYEYSKYDDIWIRQSEEFKNFWKEYILDTNQKVSDLDFDPIIRMLDTKAKGFNSESDYAVAATYIRQGTWYRTFNDLKNKKELREIMDKIFNLENDEKLIEEINKLKEINLSNKNGLTGIHANVLNALLFLNNPKYYISIVSLKHRNQIIDYFQFNKPDINSSYGEQIIKSNRSILSGFSNKLTGNWSPRTIAYYIYSPTIRSLWESKTGDVMDTIEEIEAQEVSDSSFQLEKHLEDFLIANWETTDLSKKFDLIVEEGELKSQQYPTDIGKIDLLVKDKSNGEYVVIELKKSQTSDDTIGQITRYMGWVKKNISNVPSVSGIIIAGGFDKKLKYSLEMVSNIKLLQYKISFSLEEM
ncbi:MAG: hypothetical protein STSR0008_15130 [Ignavibacterium sp.]